LATEQLVMSDAVDHAVAEINFEPLSGSEVYLDTTYLKNVKGSSFVNADYIISSLRQQLVAADCHLQDAKEKAEVIVEARVGTLGADANEVVYGMPANSSLTNAASLVPNAPVIPPFPEISIARKEAQQGAVKIALFAYDSETRRPVWQSGISRARSTAQDLWVFGAGPFQQGTIFEGPQFAGTQLRLPRLKSDGSEAKKPDIAFDREHLFESLDPDASTPEVNLASFEQEAPSEAPAAQSPALEPPPAAQTSPEKPAAENSAPETPAPAEAAETKAPPEEPAKPTDKQGEIASITDQEK
jgi:hypothetical protein